MFIDVSRAQASVSSVIAAFTATSAWLSLGLVAVTRESTRARVIALPPLWLLPLAIGAAVALAIRLRPAASRLAPLLVTLLIWLPFLPGPIPTAFLTWQGRIEAAVWAIALVGVIGPFRIPAMLAQPPRALWIAAATAGLLYAAGFSALRDGLPIGDEPQYLIMTQSLLKDGDLRIENNHKNRDYAPYYHRGDLEPHYMTRGTDGEIYSVHAPGVSVVVLPGFAMFGYAGAAATTMLIVAIGSAIGWHAAWMLTSDAVAAWLAWAAIFLTAPMYQQAVTVFPDAVGGFGVVATIWLLVALDTGRRVRTSTLWWCGAALATLPWLHSRFALLVAVLGIVVAVRLLQQHWTRAMQFLAVPAISTVLWLGFFWWIWGAPDPRAQWGYDLAGSAPAFITRGLTGQLLDQRAGLLASAPAYFCVLAGWFVLARVRIRLAIETALVAASLATSVAAVDSWWGGQGGPVRYLCAMLPVAIVPAAAFAASRRWWARPGFTIAVVMSLFLLFSRAFLDDGAFAYAPEVGVNPVIARLAPAVDLAQAMPVGGHAEALHFVTDPAAPAWRLAGVWAAVALLVMAIIVIARRFFDDSYQSSYALIACGWGVVVMIAAGASWAAQGASGLMPLSSQLAFVDRFNERWLRTSGPARLHLGGALDSGPRAYRSAQLGDVRVFFLDDRTYPEPSGFWVPAATSTTVVMALDDPERQLGLRLQAGPVPTTVEMVVGGERREFTFAPRERHEIAIPPRTAGAWKITIRPGAGFRPGDYDPNVKDARNLGIWIEVF